MAKSLEKVWKIGNDLYIEISPAMTSYLAIKEGDLLHYEIEKARDQSFADSKFV